MRRNKGSGQAQSRLSPRAETSVGRGSRERYAGLAGSTVKRQECRLAGGKEPLHWDKVRRRLLSLSRLVRSGKVIISFARGGRPRGVIAHCSYFSRVLYSSRSSITAHLSGTGETETGARSGKAISGSERGRRCLQEDTQIPRILNRNVQCYSSPCKVSRGGRSCREARTKRPGGQRDRLKFNHSRLGDAATRARRAQCLNCMRRARFLFCVHVRTIQTRYDMQ